MSKFLSAMNAAKDRSLTIAEAVEPQPIRHEIQASEPYEIPARTGRGRPAGKRSRQKTVQVTAYIDANTHINTKIALLKASQHGRKKDFSDLVQELLQNWLEIQQS